MTTTNIEQMINRVVSVFQKERRKNFIIDNDSEYSKLYLSRSRTGAAHGLFFINVEELLKNNSQVYSSLPGISNHLLNIASRSKFLELNVYRDRVKEHVIGRKRVNYSDGKYYQEPSTLIQTKEIPINATSLSPTSKTLMKYFTFSDQEVALKTAGLYQYRVEVRFRDGTYEYLYDMYKSLADTKKLLEQYYDLSISSYTDPESAGFQYDSYRNAKEFSKAAFKQYFKNGSYNQQFALKVAETFATSLDGIESRVVPKIVNAFRVFVGATNQNLEQKSLLIRNNLDPVTGNPKGIQNILKLTEVFINRLEVVLEINKLKKSPTGFTAKGTSGAFDNSSLLSNIVSQSNHTIYEEHSFDHPAELFQAMANKNIYSDYLSISSDSEILPTETMRTVSADYFIQRCELENAKFSTKPLLATDTEAEYDISLFVNNNTNDNLERTTSPKYLSNTGFSYLAPSVIELFSGIKENNFVYRSLEQPADDPELEKLLAALLGYTLTKEDEKNADLFDAPFSYQSLGYDFSLRELYKEVFEKLGMTMHDLELHQDVFQDAVGAAKIIGPTCAVEKKAVPIEGYDTQQTVDLQYTITDFSDSAINPNEYFKNFLNNQGVPSKSLPAVNLQNYSFTTAENTGNFYSLPNSFKVTSISSNHSIANSEFSTTQWKTATENLNFFGPYLFFNLNLTVKVEIFRGRMGNAKYDEESWSLLTKEDLQSQAGTLLCRMSYYDEKLTKSFNLPILDKYFLVNSNTALAAEIQETINRISRDLLTYTPSFWSKSNQLAATAYAQQTGQETNLTTDAAAAAPTIDTDMSFQVENITSPPASQTAGTTQASSGYSATSAGTTTTSTTAGPTSAPTTTTNRGSGY
jgi:hypothetical protein